MKKNKFKILNTFLFTLFGISAGVFLGLSIKEIFKAKEYEKIDSKSFFKNINPLDSLEESWRFNKVNEEIHEEKESKGV